MSQPPIWMESLVDIVSECIEPHNTMGPMGFRYELDEDLWVVIVYPSPIELIGESLDGTIVAPGFSLDLEQLRSAFEQLDEARWNAHSFGPYDLDGPHISIEGIYQKHNVWLQVLAEAPDDAEPGMKLDTTGKRVEIVPNN